MYYNAPDSNLAHPAKISNPKIPASIPTYNVGHVKFLDMQQEIAVMLAKSSQLWNFKNPTKNTAKRYYRHTLTKTIQSEGPKLSVPYKPWMPSLHQTTSMTYTSMQTSTTQLITLSISLMRQCHRLTILTLPQKNDSSLTPSLHQRQ